MAFLYFCRRLSAIGFPEAQRAPGRNRSVYHAAHTEIVVCLMDFGRTGIVLGCHFENVDCGIPVARLDPSEAVFQFPAVPCRFRMRRARARHTARSSSRENARCLHGTWRTAVCGRHCRCGPCPNDLSDFPDYLTFGESPCRQNSATCSGPTNSQLDFHVRGPFECVLPTVGFLVRLFSRLVSVFPRFPPPRSRMPGFRPK